MGEIIFTTISKTEIQTLIENAVQKAITKNESTKRNQTETILDINQAAEFIGIAKATLYGKCSAQLIPHFKKGKKLYFDKNEILTWLKSGKRKTIHDFHNEVNCHLGSKNKSQ